jgi:hypothetical protein
MDGAQVGVLVNDSPESDGGSDAIHVKVRTMAYWSLRFRLKEDEHNFLQGRNRKMAGQARNFFWLIGAFFAYFAIAALSKEDKRSTRWTIGYFIISPLLVGLGCCLHKFKGYGEWWLNNVYSRVVRHLHRLLMGFAVGVTIFLVVFPFVYSDWNWEKLVGDSHADALTRATLHRRAAATCRLTLLAWPTTLAMLSLFGLRFSDLVKLDLPFLIIYPIWFTHSKFFNIGDMYETTDAKGGFTRTMFEALSPELRADIALYKDEDAMEWENLLCISYGLLLGCISISVARSSERKGRELFHEKGHLQRVNKRLQLEMEDPFDNLNILGWVHTSSHTY